MGKIDLFSLNEAHLVENGMKEVKGGEGFGSCSCEACSCNCGCRCTSCRCSYGAELGSSYAGSSESAATRGTDYTANLHDNTGNGNYSSNSSSGAAVPPL